MAKTQKIKYLYVYEYTWLTSPFKGNSQDKVIMIQEVFTLPSPFASCFSVGENIERFTRPLAPSLFGWQKEEEKLF